VHDKAPLTAEGRRRLVARHLVEVTAAPARAQVGCPVAAAGRRARAAVSLHRARPRSRPNRSWRSTSPCPLPRAAPQLGRSEGRGGTGVCRDGDRGLPADADRLGACTPRCRAAPRRGHPRGRPRTTRTGHYLDAGEPVVLLGDSATGTSHLLIGLGLADCEQGRRVPYVTTAQLVNELVKAADDRVLSRFVARYSRVDLLCLDELGYVQIDPHGAELLFQIITEREERAAVAITANLPFPERGTAFPDPRLVAAIADRVTFNAHILETGTESYPTEPSFC